MSLLDKASLIVTPNSYKESKLYSVVPSSGAGDMDVVRATTATRVNSAGLIEVVPRNLLLNSNTFNGSGWSMGGVTLTANQPDVYGGNNAWLVQFENTISSSYLFQTIANQLNTASMWIKPTTGSIGKNVMFGIQLSVGNGNAFLLNEGWQKLTNSNTAQYFILSNFCSNFATSFYICFAQAEQGSTATEYFPTTTRLNIPRIDYTNGSCPSLLVEPQRTNVLTYSEQFDNAAWVKSSVGSGLNPVVTSNISTSPSGNNDADRIVFNTTLSTDISQIVQTIPLTVSSTGSVYLKAFASGDVGKIIAIRFNSAGYTLVTLTNSWQRFSVTATALGSFDIALRPVIGTSTGSVSVLAWGAQLEAGAYPTSYIPTVASTVTRNADVISKTGISSLIGQTEGTIFCDVTLNSRVNFTYFAIANNLASTENYLGIAFLNNAIAFESVVATVLQANISHSNTSTGRFKIAAAYKANDFILYINGTQIGTDTSGTIPACSQLGLNAYNQSQALNYNSVQLYKTRLTNTELAQLTTL